MRYETFSICLLGLATVNSEAAKAVPTAALSTSQEEAQSTYIPFDPPVGEPLRYRWEKTVSRNGEARMSWSEASYQFEKVGDGFRLTVTPISAGSNETDPDKLEIERRLAHLTNIPFTLLLTADGSIVELERGDFYWNEIIQAVKDYGSSVSPVMSGHVNTMAKILSEMPAEARLALLTESIQPLLEFGETEFVSGEPVSLEVETASPYGGVLKRKAVITLHETKNNLASLVITTTLPREELNQLMTAFTDKLASLPPVKREEMKRELINLKEFSHETRSSYRISIHDGLLHDYGSTEVIEAVDGTKRTKSETSRYLVLRD